MIKGKKALTILVVVVTILAIIASMGNLTLMSRGNKIKELLKISYAPKDLDTFDEAALEAFNYINDEDVSSLFTINGDGLTEYDLAKSVSITMDVDYGIFPKLIYRVIVVTPSGVIDLVIDMDYGLLGFGKVNKVIVYNITK